MARLLSIAIMTWVKTRKARVKCNHGINHFTRCSYWNFWRMPIDQVRIRARTRIYFAFPPFSTKTIVNGKQPQSRFPVHEGKFSLFPSSSPKGRPTISFQCLQTNTSQVASFLTYSLSTIFKTRRKYWTKYRKGSWTNQTFHLTSR